MNGKPYDNIALLSIEGKLLSFISLRRAKWYIKKELGKSEKFKCQDNTLCDAIRINFVPEIPTDKVTPLIRKKNRCVVCGEINTGDLTKHHIIPYRFRKWMALEQKSYLSNHLCVACIDCHEHYEHNFASELHEEILEKFPIFEPLQSTSSPSPKLPRLHLVKTLVNNYNKIPQERISEIFLELHSHPKTAHLKTLEDCTSFLAEFKYVREKLQYELVKLSDKEMESLHNLCHTHFNSTMKPKYPI